jgi:hypothetical protein
LVPNGVVPWQLQANSTEEASEEIEKLTSLKSFDKILPVMPPLDFILLNKLLRLTIRKFFRQTNQINSPIKI